MERHQGEHFNDHLLAVGQPPNYSGDHRHNHNHNHNHHHHHYNHHDYPPPHGENHYYQNDNNGNNNLQHQYHHCYHNNHEQHHHQWDHQQYDHFSGNQNFNCEQNDSFAGGGFHLDSGGAYASRRKRGGHCSARGASPDATDGGCLVKLYLAPVSRTSTEADIRSLFQEYGNVIDIILPKDKKTGQRQGYCFVKYATLEEGDRAISALQNQYTFPGEVTPIKVRYADGERDHIGDRIVGQQSDKLYVGCLSKQTSKMEIEEVFSLYGTIQDIYVVRDDQKQSRGCAFVQFSRREMAVAAIKALNGIFTMRGCEQPLIVKFADPKKPRSGEPRGNNAFTGPNYGPRAQEPAIRPVPNISFPVQPITANSQAQAVSQLGNQEAEAPIITQQLHPLPMQLSQQPQQSSQQSQQVACGIQKHSQPTYPSTQILEQQQNSQIAKLEIRSNSRTMTSTSISVSAPQSPNAVTLECDWSEHTCPDGYKYYYNCITYESTWEKPEEFSLFEEQLEKQQKLQNPSQQQSFPLSNCSSQQADQKQEVVDNVQAQSGTTPATGIACN